MEQLSHSTGSVSPSRFLTTPGVLVIRTTGVLLHESCGSYGCGRRNLMLSVKKSTRGTTEHFLIIFAALSISVTYNLDSIPLKPVIQLHLSRHSIVIAFNISKLHDFCCHLLWIHRLIQVRINSAGIVRIQSSLASKGLGYSFK